jgi:uncharacterized damage-inducible protein DinB
VRKADALGLFDYNYWATGQILGVCETLSLEEFTAASDVTFRNLRGTLVHTLDVERSWRRHVMGLQTDHRAALGRNPCRPVHRP